MKHIQTFRRFCSRFVVYCAKPTNYERPASVLEVVRAVIGFLFGPRQRGACLMLDMKAMTRPWSIIFILKRMQTFRFNYTIYCNLASVSLLIKNDSWKRYFNYWLTS